MRWQYIALSVPIALNCASLLVEWLDKKAQKPLDDLIERHRTETVSTMIKTNERSRCIAGLLTAVLALASNWEQAHGYGEIAGNWKVDYGITTPELRLYADTTETLTLTIYDVAVTASGTQDYYFVAQTTDERYAAASSLVVSKNEITANGSWQGALEVHGNHYGYTELYVALHVVESTNEHGIQTLSEAERSPHTLSIAVMRAHAIDEQIFTYIASGVVVLMFVNLGTVLDMQRLLALFFKPISPLIGLVNSYLLMPALGLGLGYLIFAPNKSLQLALFYTALAPSGGLANIATMFLKGNINLSVATSTLNSLLALGLMPLWIMLFAHVVYNDEQELVVPYGQLAVAAVAIIGALAVGVLLRVCIPRTTRFIFRLLKPLSVALSLCLVALTVGMNAFAFEQYTWRVLLASLCLPLLGYILALLNAHLFRRTATDALTLAIEACMLNMSLPIVLLQYSVAQPELDLILIVPIASALTSLLLVALLYAVRRCSGWNVCRDLDAFDERQLLAEENTNC